MELSKTGSAGHDKSEADTDRTTGSTSRGRSRQWAVASAVVLIVVVAIGVWIFQSGSSGSPDTSATPSDGASASSGFQWSEITDESVRDSFDLESASFYRPEHGHLPGKEAVLKDGQYQSGDTDMRVDTESDPVYTDLNGDGILDVTAILAKFGSSEKDNSEDSGWRGVYAWTWDGSKATPVKWQVAWQYNCATDPAEDGHESDYDLALKVSAEKSSHGARIDMSDSGHFCDENSAYDSAPFSTPFMIHDGAPATIYGEQTIGAMNVCDAGSSQIVDDKVDVAGTVSPLLAPGPDGPPIREGYEKVEVLEPDKLDSADVAMYGGYVPAVVSWPSNSDVRQTCAWVNWEEAR